MSKIIDDICQLYKSHGNNQYGEDITQTDHGIQCAELAIKEGYDAQMVTSALLHDIGHLLAATDIAWGNYQHAEVGCEYLAPHFGPAVTEPIRLHAEAKRYLCTVEKGYLEDLSAASLDSLWRQGGLMSEQEVSDFEQLQYADAALALRRWDDTGKVLGLPERTIEDYREMMQQAFDSNHSQLNSFSRRGFKVFEQGLDGEAMGELERQSHALNQRAAGILSELSQSQLSLGDYYRNGGDRLIAVPERDEPTKVCRFEYLAGTSDWIADSLVPKLQSMIEQATGQAFVLFKDKCNAKNPGGGAFAPHQDVIAYDKFPARCHVTAAIFLDDATVENGCLLFAEDYLSTAKQFNVQWRQTCLGELPVLPSVEGGPEHGNIAEDLTQAMDWQWVTAKRGDVVLFDSYVPHRSYKNESQLSRRAMFFTFSPESEGDSYEAYYQMKRNQYDNPVFHVATPTAHKAL